MKSKKSKSNIDTDKEFRKWLENLEKNDKDFIMNGMESYVRKRTENYTPNQMAQLIIDCFEVQEFRVNQDDGRICEGKLKYNNKWITSEYEVAHVIISSISTIKNKSIGDIQDKIKVKHNGDKDDNDYKDVDDFVLYVFETMHQMENILFNRTHTDVMCISLFD